MAFKYVVKGFSKVQGGKLTVSLVTSKNGQESLTSVVLRDLEKLAVSCDAPVSVFSPNGAVEVLEVK